MRMFAEKVRRSPRAYPPMPAAKKVFLVPNPS